MTEACGIWTLLVTAIVGLEFGVLYLDVGTRDAEPKHRARMTGILIMVPGAWHPWCFFLGMTMVLLSKAWDLPGWSGAVSRAPEKEEASGTVPDAGEPVERMIISNAPSPRAVGGSTDEA